MKIDNIIKKIKRYIKNIDYGKIIITIHQGEVTYIEKQEKEKLN